MNSLENNEQILASVAIHEPSSVEATTTKVKGYEAVRFNALKHGILSKLVVLAHEDGAEFADLLAALIEEHRPSGITERILIEDFAAIIWRKRRVLLAEGAKINDGLKGVVNNPTGVVTSSAPLQRGLSGVDSDLRDLFEMSAEEVANSQRDAKFDLDATQKAASILRKGGAHAYARARRTLTQDSRNWWDTHVAEGSYPETAEGLTEFIRESLEPICYRMLNEAQFSSAIKAQALGEGLQVHRLEKLNRYESHLDRKFEKTLAMLLKVKLLRDG